MTREAALLEFVERLRKFTSGRRALHVRLSQLRAHNRQEHHKRIAATTFDKLVRDFDGTLFWLFNDDMFIICNGASAADIDDAVLHLRYLFGEDPFLTNDKDGAEQFCIWFNLEEDYPELLEFAQRMVSARAQHDQKGNKQPGKPVPKSKPAKPLNPRNLVVIESAIAQADLSSIICRQPICAVVRNQIPKPVYYETYTSIDSLRQMVMPDIDLHANRWLFQHLTQHLDRRMIAHLAHNDDATLGQAFSMNLNVSTLQSPEFLDFDKSLKSGIRGSVVIELQLFDVFGDLGSFMFARDYLRERGYKFCLDSTTQLSLPLINREELGFDLVKLLWSADLYDQLNGPRGQDLRRVTGRIGSERLILARCDSERALEAGESLGIRLYQGHLLDEMLKRKISRQDSVEALTEALARRRAARRR